MQEVSKWVEEQSKLIKTFNVRFLNYTKSIYIFFIPDLFDIPNIMLLATESTHFGLRLSKRFGTKESHKKKLIKF